MWWKPAVAGAAIVTGLALGAGAGGTTTPADVSSTVPAEQPARDHDQGQKRGHEKHDKPVKAAKPDRPVPDDLVPVPPGVAPLPPGLQKKGEACVRPVRYEGGPLEACPWKPHPHGKVVPVGPRPYSATEE